ncbi:chorion peroxidase-like [Bradysia coprophila]|uniref:chorion peroxidase-like n=1 Tax=Bradysia coprophila TaxID=38358 RepID=UPI00187D7D7B|nr:chorion peroxidase-like [Bradysia coprophila]
MRNVKNLVESETYYNSFLERIGLVSRSSIFRIDSYNEYINMQAIEAKIQTVGAQIFKNELNVSSCIFETIYQQCSNKDIGQSTMWHFKYRSIDGRGNNLKNPDWGASNTPFSRFGPKNYEDGIYAIRKSVTGSDLPNARLLVQNVLLKAVRSPPPASQHNSLGLLIVLFATHDLHYQAPMQTKSGQYEIRCCSKEHKNVLPSALSHSSCLPIDVSKSDPFFKKANIGCLNMVRAQLGKYGNGVETGQIMNRATAYLDLSLIYGNNESELKPLRIYRRGKLRLGKGGILPVDSNGNYLPSMDRFIVTPIGSIWPALFSRNHNHLAERLTRLNPRWSDERIFQEARRINIANFQFNLITAKSIEKISNRVVNATYSHKTNVATSVEFALTYRGAHYYLPAHMLFHGENNRSRRYLQSNTIGRIDLLENGFDDALRGVLNQPVNVGRYSDEVLQKRSN